MLIPYNDAILEWVADGVAARLQAGFADSKINFRSSENESPDIGGAVVEVAPFPIIFPWLRENRRRNALRVGLDVTEVEFRISCPFKPGHLPRYEQELDGAVRRLADALITSADGADVVYVGRLPLPIPGTGSAVLVYTGKIWARAAIGFDFDDASYVVTLSVLFGAGKFQTDTELR